MELTFQNTYLGWVVTSTMSSSSNRFACHFSTTCDVQGQLEKFWTIEEVPKNVVVSPECKNVVFTISLTYVSNLSRKL